MKPAVGIFRHVQGGRPPSVASARNGIALRSGGDGKRKVEVVCHQMRNTCRGEYWTGIRLSTKRGPDRGISRLHWCKGVRCLRMHWGVDLRWWCDSRSFVSWRRASRWAPKLPKRVLAVFLSPVVFFSPVRFHANVSRMYRSVFPSRSTFLPYQFRISVVYSVKFSPLSLVRTPDLTSILSSNAPLGSIF